MQALMVIGTIMQVVGSISAGYQQAAALEQQADMYMKQAQIYGAQAKIDEVENDRRIALEKQSAAQESLERTQRLRRIVGETTAAGAAAGIQVNYGTITSLNEYSSSQASIEDAIAEDNLNNRVISLNLNSAINQQNLYSQARGSVFQAGQLKNEASQAISKGWMSGMGSLFNYSMDQYGRGTVPKSQSVYRDGTVVTWDN